MPSPSVPRLDARTPERLGDLAVEAFGPVPGVDLQPQAPPPHEPPDIEP